MLDDEGRGGGMMDSADNGKKRGVHGDHRLAPIAGVARPSYLTLVLPAPKPASGSGPSNSGAPASLAPPATRSTAVTAPALDVDRRRACAGDSPRDASSCSGVEAHGVGSSAGISEKTGRGNGSAAARVEERGGVAASRGEAGCGGCGGGVQRGSARDWGGAKGAGLGGRGG
jgi:hypothetical protein